MMKNAVFVRAGLALIMAFQDWPIYKKFGGDNACENRDLDYQFSRSSDPYEWRSVYGTALKLSKDFIHMLSESLAHCQEAINWMN